MSFAATTETLRAAWTGDGTTLPYVQLLAGLSNEQAADACGVSLRTYRRWLSSHNPPLSSLKLLAVLAGYVPWSAWRDWEVHQGLLFPPGYTRHGIGPGHILGLPYLRSAVRIYRNENLAFRRMARETPPDGAAQQGRQGALEHLPGAEVDPEGASEALPVGDQVDGAAEG